jgi:antitoxin (DNA-binding transcriptional repressor) of toxin-antitoxin stability system
MQVDISAIYLAEHLSEVLDRVQERGDRFTVYQDGEKIALIAPVPTVRGTTWEQFTARVPNLEFPGEGFADDLEAIQASQGIAEIPEWPD